MTLKELYHAIKVERKRQVEKWGQQKLSLRIWVWVWLEEVGEYYQAKLELRAARAGHFVMYHVANNGRETEIKLYWEREARKELIQVLAVIVSFFHDYRPWHGIWRIY